MVAGSEVDRQEFRGIFNVEEGERRRDERGRRKRERRRHDGWRRRVVERKGGDPPDEWVDTYWREKQESGWVPDGIRRRKDVAATTSARRRREKAPSSGTACSPQDEPRDWLAMS